MARLLPWSMDDMSSEGIDVLVSPSQSSDCAVSISTTNLLLQYVILLLQCLDLKSGWLKEEDFK